VLSGLGLVPAVSNQVDGSVPAGTVVGTNPAADSVVPVGSKVTLLVAVPPAPSPTPSDGPSADASPTPTKR
jgi:serine/threonine-protein kinase